MVIKLHEPYRGSKLDPSKDRPRRMACAFCGKQFATLVAVKMHEESFHKKQLRKRMTNERSRHER